MRAVANLTAEVIHCEHRARGAGAGASVAASRAKEENRDLQRACKENEPGSSRGEGGGAASSAIAASRADSQKRNFVMPKLKVPEMTI